MVKRSTWLNGHRISPRKRGFTLIELLVYIAMLFVITGMAYATFYRTRDHARDLSRNADDVARVLTAGERWREDVRRATGRLQLTGNEGEQNLRIPQTDGYVEYQFRTNQVLRRPGAETPAVPVLIKVKTSIMQAEARAKVTAWRWDLELQGRPDPGRLRPLFSFQAVAAAEQSK